MDVRESPLPARTRGEGDRSTSDSPLALDWGSIGKFVRATACASLSRDLATTVGEGRAVDRLGSAFGSEVDGE